MRVFGCVTYIHSKQGKVDLRALKYMFFGYPDGTKGYKLWDSKSKNNIMSIDVIFREEEFFMNQKKETAKIQRDLKEHTFRSSRSKVKFSKKEKEEAHEEQPKEVSRSY